jgi:hypothetical protein
LRNDDNDLIPHHTLEASFVKPQSLSSNITFRNLQATGDSTTTKIQVKTLVEPYPGGYCFNQG